MVGFFITLCLAQQCPFIRNDTRQEGIMKTLFSFLIAIVFLFPTTVQARDLFVGTLEIRDSKLYWCVVMW